METKLDGENVGAALIYIKKIFKRFQKSYASNQIKAELFEIEMPLCKSRQSFRFILVTTVRFLKII